MNAFTYPTGIPTPKPTRKMVSIDQANQVQGLPTGLARLLRVSDCGA
jgi:hypothetical protein